MALSTREADATFADLICADPQWVDAEFDALVAASFGRPPVSPPPAPPSVPPVPGTPRPPSRRPSPGPAGDRFPANGPGQHRERSPPARQAADRAAAQP